MNSDDLNVIIGLVLGVIGLIVTVVVSVWRVARSNTKNDEQHTKALREEHDARISREMELVNLINKVRERDRDDINRVERRLDVLEERVGNVPTVEDIERIVSRMLLPVSGQLERLTNQLMRLSLYDVRRNVKKAGDQFIDDDL